jgi:hypothetical protein
VDDAVRMTYAELARARGVTVPTARRMATRYKWAKHLGNDGLARVTVPVAALRADARADGGTSGATGAVEGPTTVYMAEGMAVLEAALGALREQLTRANERADKAERAAGMLRAKLTAARYVGEFTRGEVADLRQEVDRLTALLAARRRWWSWGSR